jgi:fatty-acyl-CoA synthase
MLGLMQDRPLLISQIIDYAAAAYPDVEIVTRTVEGPIHRYGYKDAHKRAKQLAEALQGLGIKLGDRVGTHRLERLPAFRAVLRRVGQRRGCCTPSTRALRPEHVAYIANHAEDQMHLRRHEPSCRSIKAIYVNARRCGTGSRMCEADAHMPADQASPTCAATRS